MKQKLLTVKQLRKILKGVPPETTILMYSPRSKSICYYASEAFYEEVAGEVFLKPTFYYSDKKKK